MLLLYRNLLSSRAAFVPPSGLGLFSRVQYGVTHQTRSLVSFTTTLAQKRARTGTRIGLNRMGFYQERPWWSSCRSLSGPVGSNRNSKPEEDESSLGMRERMKRFGTKYGMLFTVYWGSLYFLSGLGIYGGLELCGGEMGLDLARTLYLDRLVSLDNIDPRAGNLALAIVLNEAFEIVRFPFAAATTPYVAKLRDRYMVARGRDPNQPRESFMDLVKKHGVFFLGYWTATWAVTGLGIYTLIEIFGPETGLNIVNGLGLNQLEMMKDLHPSTGNVAIAVALNELFEVVRLPFVLATLTSVKKLFKR